MYYVPLAYIRPIVTRWSVWQQSHQVHLHFSVEYEDGIPAVTHLSVCFQKQLNYTDFLYPIVFT